jgi:hypothetical protein
VWVGKVAGRWAHAQAAHVNYTRASYTHASYKPHAPGSIKKAARSGYRLGVLPAPSGPAFKEAA